MGTWNFSSPWLGDETDRKLNTNTCTTAAVSASSSCTLHDNPEWTQLACGTYHTAALTKRGEVFTWGYHYDGQLGHGDDKGCKHIPTKVASLDGVIIVKIACGVRHMAALTDKGELLTWCVYRYISHIGLTFFQFTIQYDMVHKNSYRQGEWLPRTTWTWYKRKERTRTQKD